MFERQFTMLIKNYFRFIFPFLILLLLGRETAILMATPNEHLLVDINYFVPSLIKIDTKKANLSKALNPYFSSNKLVYAQYKPCQVKLQIYKNYNQLEVESQLKICLKILDDALKVAPASQLVWYEKALLHSQQNNAEKKFNLSLHNMWIVAHRQSWIAHRRILLSLDNWVILNQKNKINAELDFLRYGSNTNILRKLARQFLADANAKPIIENWIRKSEKQVQRRFVNYVRAAR